MDENQKHLAAAIAQNFLSIEKLLSLDFIAILGLEMRLVNGFNLFRTRVPIYFATISTEYSFVPSCRGGYIKMYQGENYQDFLKWGEVFLVHSLIIIK